MNSKPLNEIKNRRDFSEAFQEAMSGAYESLRRHWTFEKDQNLPKTYLVEFHPRYEEGSPPTWDSEAVFSALKETSSACSANVRRTQDDSILFLSHQEKDKQAEFIVDCLNPRFLAFHTISNAGATDRFIFERLTQYQPEFDLFWLPVSLLEDVERREKIIGWQAQFEPLIDGGSFSADSEADTEIVEGTESSDLQHSLIASDHPVLNMRVIHPDALKTYRKLKDAPDILPDVPLNAVLTERSDEQGGISARAQIKSNGKVTGRGADFDSYLHIVNGTLDGYSDLVQRLESKYWINLVPVKMEPVNGFKVYGEPFCIKFDRKVDVDKVIQAMFDCKRPFRLMGVPEKIYEDYYSVDAIDLHINQRVGFEICPEFMRIYLYAETCGNTLVRIVRSLQHHIDSRLSHPPLVS